MKTTILIFILAFQSLSLLSQDNSSTNDGHFIAVKAGYENKKQTLAKGDKIVIKLMNNKKVLGEIEEIRQDYFVMNSGDKVMVSDIQWIKKSKISSARTAVGLTVLAAGVITVLVITPTVDFDVINQVGFFGIGLTVTGIAILSTRTKYKLQRGDRLIYKD